MVKYADSPRAEVDIGIASPPATIWPLVIDINTPARFSAEFQGATWLDEGPAVGARFEGRNRHEAVGEWTVTCTVTDFEPERVFEWTVGDLSNKVARWRFELSADPDVGSRLRFSAEMGPGPSGLTPAIERMPEREEDIVANRLEQWTANMTRTVEGIRDLVEQAAGSPAESED